VLTAAAHAQQTQTGTILGVPIAELERFRLANATEGVDSFGQPLLPNDVTVLHVSAAAGSPFNTEIATVSVTTRAGAQKAWRISFPLSGDGLISPLYAQINANDFFVQPRVIGSGHGAALQVDVRQNRTGSLPLESLRFLLVPADAVDRLASGNPRARLTTLHLQRSAVGSRLLWVQLIDAEGASQFMIPGDLASDIQALNTNLTVTSGNLVRVN
jgi:hypothetical protein